MTILEYWRPLLAREIPRAFILSLLCFALGGCGEDSPNLRPLAENAVIVAFGDSLTEGTGTDSHGSYPHRLAELSGRKVINAGIAGEISSAGLSRLPEVLSTHSPQLVVLCHGGNDLLRKLDEELLSENLTAMVRQIEQSGADVVLLGVPKPALFLGPAEVYKTISSELKLVSNLKIISKILAQPNLKSDPVHPNSTGYDLLAQAVHSTLRKAGAY